MITVETSHNDLEYVRQRLGGLEDQAPKTLKDAINRTAKETRKLLASEAQARYTVKNAGFNSRIEIRNATNSSLQARLFIKGRTLTLPRFRTTFSKKYGVRTEIVKGHGLKPVTLSGGVVVEADKTRDAKGIKAFLGKVASGKKKSRLEKIVSSLMAKLGVSSSGEENVTMTKQVLQRRTKRRYPLKVLRGPSVPKMLEEVYDGKSVTSSHLKAEIERIYHENVEAGIIKVLAP